jgi:hypothetical protein
MRMERQLVDGAKISDAINPQDDASRGVTLGDGWIEEKAREHGFRMPEGTLTGGGLYTVLGLIADGAQFLFDRRRHDEMIDPVDQQGASDIAHHAHKPSEKPGTGGNGIEMAKDEAFGLVT